MAGRLLLFDALEMSTTFVALRKNPKCKVCGPEPEITGLIDYEAFCGTPAHDHSRGSAGEEWDISPRQLAERIRSGPPLQLVDVREPVELQVSRLPGAIVIPFGQLAARLEELDKKQDIVLFCRTGNRSSRALQIMVQAGFTKVKNLRGGINAWVETVDSSLMKY
jgi:rhodanese-related sulfurtransferase